MWREKILDFAKKLDHPAWGFPHLQRVYDMAMLLFEQETITADEEVIFAASYLHDVGAFEPYKKLGIDHAVRSAEFCDEVLKPMGFPEGKIGLVKEVILGHMFYATPELKDEVIFFRDADILDFMGYIGISRILAMVKLDEWTPDMMNAVELIKRFSKELQRELYTSSAKDMGRERTTQMEEFLKGLSAQTKNLAII